MTAHELQPVRRRTDGRSRPPLPTPNGRGGAGPPIARKPYLLVRKPGRNGDGPVVVCDRVKRDERTYRRGDKSETKGWSDYVDYFLENKQGE